MNRKIIYLIAIFTLTSYSFANEALETFKKANMFYQNGYFSKAALNYEKIINNGYENGEIYYNLGNTYFRMNKIPNAIINYERALRLSPDDEDVIVNLNVANLRIVDKIEPLPKFFLVQWYEGIRNILSSGNWAVILVISVWIVFICLAVFVFFESPFVKKLLFGTLVLSVVVAVFSFMFSIQQNNTENSRNFAIVFEPTVYVKSSPDEEGKDLFILHEGTKVNIVDAVGKWRKIKLANGNIGWLPGEAVEII
ncbi:MAG: tetratricopeptide repeat protein [Ignavibacteriae bacterium]|nr:tetratricopeptide repeat protein [Ignavibacteriota bacterium]